MSLRPDALRRVAALACMGVIAAPLQASGGDIAYGEYLAGDCTGCHRPEGAEGIPSIAGRAPEDFTAALSAFRDGSRDNPAMRLMAERLTEEEVAALAAYFQTIEPY